MDEAAVRRNVDSRQRPLRQPHRDRRRRLPDGALGRHRRRPGHRRRRPARAHPGRPDPRPGLRGPHRVQRRAHRGRLLRGDRGQDGVADGVELPGRGPRRGPRRGAHRGAHRVRPLLRDGVPAARRRPGPRRPRQPARQARRARTWPRASTPCPRSSRCATTAVGDELRSILGHPLDDEDRERARKLVVGTDAIPTTVAAAGRFLDEARAALGVLGPSGLSDGLGSLIGSLLEDLPEGAR